MTAKTPKPKPAYDALLDQPPLPEEVVESDTDSAWNLWHETAFPPETLRDELRDESNFSETEAMHRPDEPATKK